MKCTEALIRGRVSHRTDESPLQDLWLDPEFGEDGIDMVIFSIYSHKMPLTCVPHPQDIFVNYQEYRSEYEIMQLQISTAKLIT